MAGWSDVDRFTARISYGVADNSDMSEILTARQEIFKPEVHLAGIDFGYMLVHDLFNNGAANFDFYIMAGLYKYDEQGIQPNPYGETLYGKFFFNFFPFGIECRLGGGIGFSYTNRIAYVEQVKAARNEDKNSNFLVYLDISIDFSIGGLTHIDLLKQTFIGYNVYHRSGVFGLVNNVRKGGSNYDMFYIQQNF